MLDHTKTFKGRSEARLVFLSPTTDNTDTDRQTDFMWYNELNLLVSEGKYAFPN